MSGNLNELIAVAGDVELKLPDLQTEIKQLPTEVYVDVRGRLRLDNGVTMDVWLNLYSAEEWRNWWSGIRERIRP